ncbi:restriction endonuclease subunit S [Vibrio parahaemolyticus]|nr:restriction endonuclease subunit S [Vibrio parahaemolyticus]MDF4509020.1 restriction endonuclease subunit S [Vibrio parahaemolyticus]MDF4531440.1 restriction endonuclease subunit S [Vibrio parahaemolyticus]MDG3369345.1 restriction endonuclease subunit S [Vibrio parahaemolyticus]MDG3373998.1 restriction endonuclease subunit S [Vibrio parahaemolyticus]
MTEQMNVPKLRFRDFSEGFSVTPLSEIISKLESGVSVNSEDVPPKSNEYGILKTSAIYAGNFIPEQAKLITDESELQRAKLNPKKDSIIISRMNTPALVGESGYVSKDYPNLFIPDRLWQATISTKYSARWLSYLLTSPRTRFIISSKGTGTSNSMKNISKPSFLSINVATPALPEQQKIASFLSKVDEKVALLTEKKDKLTEYKKGVMQQLFNGKWEEQDGQLIFIPPTLRFKADDGSEFPDWIEKRLGKVFTRIRRKNKENNQNVLTISAQQGLINQEKYFNKSVSAKDVTGYYLLENGDFAYNKSYSKGYPMGAIKRLNNYDKGVVSTLYICFGLNQDQGFVSDFFEHYFESGLQNRDLSKIAQEGARNHGLLNISVDEFFKDVKLLTPSHDEQIKIANFISAINQKIDLTNSELEKAKEWKKGLLQQMFV